MQKSPKYVVRPPLLGAQDVCEHRNVVPVELKGSGETVAKLCAGCDKQLPEWFMPGMRRRP